MVSKNESLNFKISRQGAPKGKIEVYGLPILIVFRIMRAEIFGREFGIGPPEGGRDRDFGMHGKLGFLADPIVGHAIESSGLKRDLFTIEQRTVGRFDEISRIPIGGVNLGDLADQHTSGAVPIGRTDHLII